MGLQTPYIQIDGAFTKGFIGGYNQIGVPASYSTYLRNCRIENNSIIMRDGFRAYTSMGNLGKYRKLKNVGGQLYAITQRTLSGSKRIKLYHLLPTNYFDTGTVGDANVVINKDDIDIVAVGDMAIVLAKGERPQYSINGQEAAEIEDSKMVNLDGGTAIDNNFSSCMGAFYSGFVFINEIQKGVKTNRVVLSHEVNMDTTNRRNNARDFSAQRDADDLEIPYKIVCPTTVTGIIGTMQNLYIFCEDSIQYLDQSILQEYATNKTLRSVPIANGYELNNHHLATAAGNFVFFFSRDKHVRSIGYTSGIYDPQIADLTDTEFGIQRWINDNIGDDQSEGFAFFNKKDQTVEFYLTSKRAESYNQRGQKLFVNDIILIWDLQHQSRLIDTGKYFGAMENFNRPWTATGEDQQGNLPSPSEQTGVANVVAGGTGFLGYRPTNQSLQGTTEGVYETGQFYYQTETKYDTTCDDDSEIKVHPIEFEYNTTNIGLVGKNTELAEMKLFSGVRLTGAINIHAGNTQTHQGETYEGKFKVTVYIDGIQQCTKELERANIYDYYKKHQIEVGGPDLKDFDPTNRESVLEYDRLLFPMDLVLDQSMVRKKGKRIRVKIECATPGADLYLSGLAIQAKQLGHFDLADKY